MKIVDNNEVDITLNPIVKTSYGFTNREYDSESGLMYYRARFYSPEIGRFLSEDPFSGLRRTPVSVINKYIYSFNNPGNYIDPDGKFAFLVGVVLSGLVSGYFTEKAGGTFLEGFTTGVVSASTIAVGAFAGAYIASLGAGFSGAWSLALAGGTTSTIIGGFIGGAIAGRYNAINNLGLRDNESLLYATAFGGLGGLGLGMGGFKSGYGFKEFFTDKNGFAREVALGLSVQGCVWGDSSLEDGGETVEVEGQEDACMGPTTANGRTSREKMGINYSYKILLKKMTHFEQILILFVLIVIGYFTPSLIGFPEYWGYLVSILLVLQYCFRIHTSLKNLDGKTLFFDSEGIRISREEEYKIDSIMIRHIAENKINKGVFTLVYGKKIPYKNQLIVLFNDNDINRFKLIFKNKFR